MTARKFTIEEIRYYLDGCKFNRDGDEDIEVNDAIRYALCVLEDKEDGIEAVIERRNEQQIKI